MLENLIRAPFFAHEIHATDTKKVLEKWAFVRSFS
jgi:hypothetical protein